MNKLNTLFGLILITSILFLVACGDSGNNTSTEETGKSYEFKMTHVTQTGHIWHKFSEKFGEELKNRSDGRMTLEIFPAAQLGPEADMVQQLSTGSLDFALLTVPYLSTRFPELDAWNLPFLFNDYEEVLTAQNTEPAQKMLDLLSTQGLVGMDYFFPTNHNLFVKGDPIKTVDDVVGKKLRFTGGKSVLDYWSRLGASPIAMGLQEVYNAMQTGVIDGMSIDINPMHSEKLYEVGDTYIKTNHMAFGGIVTASKVNYQNMPEEDRKIIDEAVATAVEWAEKEIVKIENENLIKLQEFVNVVELENRQQFIEEATPIYEEYSSQYTLIKEFVDTVKK